MAHTQAGLLLRQLRRLAGGPVGAGSPDRELLERFAARRDEAAFAELVGRHGPMVLRACRRVLGDWQMAEDAFQATFLVLARKVGGIARRECLAGWLHGVAYRVAVRARVEAAKRRDRERCAAPGPRPDPLDELSARELCAVLDEELTRLPDRYRLPLLLCHLEGRTRDEAAGQLGMSVRTLTRRLQRGRQLLRLRLTRRGVTLSGALLLPALVQPAPTAVPSLLVASTVRGGVLFAGGSAIGGVPASPAALAEGLMPAVSASKVRVIVALLVAASLTGAGAGGLTQVFRPNDRREGPNQATRHEAGGPPVQKAAPVDANGDPLPPGAVARLGTKRLRHQHTVRSVAFSKDGTRVVSAGWDGTMRVWDAETGRELHRVRQPGGSAVAISPDGKTAASGGMDKSFHVWDLATNREMLRAVDLENSVMAIQFAPHGTTLATLSSPVIRIWDLAAGKEVGRVVGPEKGVYSMAFSPDGKLLAGGCEDQTVRLWDAKSGREVHRLTGHADFIYAVAFAPDGRTLASAGADKDRTIRFWDVATGTETRKVAGAAGWVRPIAFSPDGSLMASGGQDGAVHLFDVATGRELRQCRLPGTADTWVFTVAFAPDGKRLVSSGTDKLIRLWDVATGQEIRPRAGHQGELAQVAIAADGRSVWTAGHDGRICRWDRATGRILWQAQQPVVSDMAVSGEGKLMVTAGGDQGVVRLWDAASGTEVRSLTGPKGWVRALALAPDASVVAAAAWDRTIRLWNTRTGQECMRITLPSAQNKDYRGACPLAFTPDGKTLISGSADNGVPAVYLWDTGTGKELRRIKHHASRMALAPDGRTLATMSGDDFTDSILHFWDTGTGQELRRIDMAPRGAGPPPEGLARGCMAFAPDGRSIATGDNSGVIHVWELTTGGERRTLRGHETGREGEGGVGSFAAGVSALAFTPDGQTLASGGGDTTVLIWDVRAVNGQRRPIDTLWADLAGDDARIAFDALCGFVAAPAATVQFLKTRLVPVAAPDPGRTARLIADLDSEQFEVRARATRELERMGEGVVPALRGALENKPSPELRRRAGQIIHQLTTPTADGLRAVRAVEVLEAVGSAEARALLTQLAQGLPEARQTREARASLERLAKRSR